MQKKKPFFWPFCCFYCNLISKFTCVGLGFYNAVLSIYMVKDIFWNLDKITVVIFAYDLFAFKFEKTVVSLNVLLNIPRSRIQCLLVSKNI